MNATVIGKVDIKPQQRPHKQARRQDARPMTVTQTMGELQYLKKHIVDLESARRRAETQAALLTAKVGRFFAGLDALKEQIKTLPTTEEVTKALEDFASSTEEDFE